MQFARYATEVPRDGGGYDARERRREEMVAAASREGRADPRITGELDRCMAAAERRLGEDGMRVALRAAAHEGRMAVPASAASIRTRWTNWPGVSPWGGTRLPTARAWEKRLGREAWEAEREHARAEERQQAGLLPERSRERQR